MDENVDSGFLVDTEIDEGFSVDPYMVIYQVFALLDSNKCITDIWSTGNQCLGDSRNIEDMQELGYVKIDEGTDGAIFGHAQVNYLQMKYGKPKFDDKNFPNYKYVDKVIELSSEEKEELFIKPQESIKQKEEQELKLNNMMLMAQRSSFLNEMLDEQAIEVPLMFTSWNDYADGFEFTENKDRVEYNGGLWKCKKTHKKQASWYPGADPTLFVQLDKDEHKGTQEDPIPVPSSVTTSGFEYTVGKYYLEGEDIYLCKRQGMEDGETIQLYFAPSSLIGQYFEKYVVESFLKL